MRVEGGQVHSLAEDWENLGSTGAGPPTGLGPRDSQAPRVQRVVRPCTVVLESLLPPSCIPHCRFKPQAVLHSGYPSLITSSTC